MPDCTSAIYALAKPMVAAAGRPAIPLSAAGPRFGRGALVPVPFPHQFDALVCYHRFCGVLAIAIWTRFTVRACIRLPAKPH
jgi:hypothetical protein